LGGGGYIENKKQMGRGGLYCSTLDLYYRQLTERVPETSRGILNVDRMSEPNHKLRRD